MSAAVWPSHLLAPDTVADWSPHEYPGRLIVVEGVDGSGRSTQLDLLEFWLKVQGYPVVRSAWNSSRIAAKTIRDARKLQSLTPLTYSVLHATDVAARHESDVVPALKAGFIVLADRYIFTAFARDIARGVDPDWLYNLYSFALKPDLTITLQVSTDLSLERIRNMVGEVSFEEAEESASVRGALRSFREFQDQVVAEYARLQQEFGLVAVDASQPLRTVQLEIRQHVAAVLETMS